MYFSFLASGAQGYIQRTYVRRSHLPPATYRSLIKRKVGSSHDCLYKYTQIQLFDRKLFLFLLSWYRRPVVWARSPSPVFLKHHCKIFMFDHWCLSPPTFRNRQQCRSLYHRTCYHWRSVTQICFGGGGGNHKLRKKCFEIKTFYKKF